jgi:hypothetical protein
MCVPGVRWCAAWPGPCRGRVAERIAAGRQQVTLLARINGGEFALIDQQLGSSAARPCVAKILVEFIAPAQGQFPWILGSGTVTIRTFDFHISQQGTGDIPVAVHGCGGVAILAEQPAFRVAFTGFKLMMYISLIRWRSQVAPGV